MMHKEAHNIGKETELFAQQYLIREGLVLITKNFRCRGGEIDLIMQDNKALVFIEVRFRRSATFGSAIESVTQQKQARIIHTAHFFLQQHPKQYQSYRFDVIAITPSGKKNEIQWIKDAFQLS
jgi:putative endonuclease